MVRTDIVPGDHTVIWKQECWVIISSFAFTIWERLEKPLKFVSKNVDHNIYPEFLSKRFLRTRQKSGMKIFLILQSPTQILLLWLYELFLVCKKTSSLILLCLPLAIVNAYQFLACLCQGYVKVSVSFCPSLEDLGWVPGTLLSRHPSTVLKWVWEKLKLCFQLIS